jgi:hypothetical protein
VNPLSVYSQTKVDSENILMASKAPDFAPTILRLGTLFGLSRADAVRFGGESVRGACGGVRGDHGAERRISGVLFCTCKTRARAVIACLDAATDAQFPAKFLTWDPRR